MKQQRWAEAEKRKSQKKKSEKRKSQKKDQCARIGRKVGRQLCLSNVLWLRRLEKKVLQWTLGSFQIFVYGGIELYYRYLFISPKM
jgi:hypothetical protein